MCDPVQIVTLRPTDIPLMRGLLRVFAKAFEEPETYLGNQPSDAYLFDLLGMAHFIAISAVIGDNVIGGLAAYQLDKFEQDRREIYIYDLAVVEQHRRRGIATNLLHVLCDEATRRDAYVVFVQTDPVDAPAIALYEKFGTRETAHQFDIVPTRTVLDE